MGHQYLHGFMTLLSSFRNQESEYLQPLLAKASRTLAAELSVPAALSSPTRIDELVGNWRDEVLEDTDIQQRHGIVSSDLME